MFSIRYPSFAKNRGPGFWLKFNNLFVSRRKIFRSDNSNDWRYTYGEPEPPDRSLPFSSLLKPGSSTDEGFRFIIIGDTGEGDRSQYGTLPLIRALKPDFMIINGDIAYPAGRINVGNRNKDDYLAGFFEPYRNLDIPIWSVPGNHEYYAAGQGREYYETFCSRKFASRWSKYGLRMVPQPGTYWELKEPNPNLKLSVIGIDTGKKGNLDGDPGTRRRLPRPDSKQHTWLEERLARADKEDCKVIVLYHIPALSREKNNKDIHLKNLHRIFASHKSVRLAVCGHDHNYQGYSRATFAKYIKDISGRGPSSEHALDYIVTGGGGAYLTSTDFKRSFWDRLFGRNLYASEILYPTPDQWNNYARIGRKTLETMGLSKSFVSRIVGIKEKDSLSDMDAAQYLNLLLVEVKKKNTTSEFSVVVTPVFMDNLKNMFVNVPEEAILDIMSEDLPVNPDRLDACLKREMAIRF